MAAQTSADGGGLRGLFETPMPENPTLLEALSTWTHHHRRRVVAHPSSNNTLPVVDTAAFTEIFGELHFREKPEQHRAVLLPPAQQAPASWAEESKEDESSLDALLRPRPAAASSSVKRSASFCVKRRSSASALLMCTEGLGSESTVDADNMLKDDAVVGEERAAADEDGAAEETKEEEEERAAPPSSFPPPIRSIGRGGKPGVCFRSFRVDGRFVLVEMVIPGKELLHACRDGGRLRLQFAAAGVGVGEEARGEDDDHAENAFVAEGGSNPNPIVCPN
ncbi:hypothetical protein QOZ80_5AG0381990 [Eleusine coracana subsp. coracana]|nr:hypothetical protein QOZ80_5AG0381990 [Eleusine coracana subsp. coracana]